MKSTAPGLVAVLALVLLAAWAPAEAQQPVAFARIGVLALGDPPSEPSPRFEAFRRGLRERGWVEGQNAAIEWRFAGTRSDRLPDLAAELVRLKVDAIFAVNTPPTQAARNATTTVPIVFTGIGNPLVTGLVATLARPGGNVGVTTVSAEMSGKRLELIKEVLPRITRVAVLWNAPNEGSAAIFREIRSQPSGSAFVFKTPE